MSFTFRDLWGQFHTFTSLPLVHTSNSDFWDNVFDLASCWFPNLLYTEIFTHHNIRIWTSLDSRISQVRDSRSSCVHDSRSSQVHDSRSSQIRDFKALQVHDSRSSQIQPPWNGQQIYAKKPDSAVIFAHYLKTYSMNFGKPDISRV
jgi:hypothetical protein